MSKLPDSAKLSAWVRTQVSPKRYRHVQGVVKTSKRLAARFGLSESKAQTAAWLHDCAKELSRGEMARWIRGTPFGLDALERKLPGLWHPHAGAAIALRKWNVRDTEVLEAIRCHTLGSEKMKPLAQVVFVADFIEPGREFEGVREARRMAKTGLANGVRFKAGLTLEHLWKNRQVIHPRLVLTWNAFLKIVG
ncbi:MAG: bis(5'-nucleosyl)-tetraphosphatase (symmetrical) YqeK [bacterium]